MATDTMEPPVKEPEVKGLNPVADSFSEKVLKNLKASQEAKEKPPATEESKAADDASKAKAEPTETTTENPLLKAYNGKKTEPAKVEEVKESTETKESGAKDKDTNLANLRKKSEALERERDEWKSKAEKPEPPEDYVRLKEEHALMQSALKKYNLAETPEFKNKYDAKLEGSKKTLQHVLSKTDVSPAEFIALVESPDSKERRQQISEITGTMDDLSKNLIHSQIAAYDSVRMERESELAQPDQSLIQITERQRQQQEARRIEQEGVIDNVWAMAEKEVPWLAISDDTSEEMRQEVQQIRDLATEVWKKPVGPEKQAALVLAGAMMPFHQKIISGLQEEVQKLNSQLAQSRSGTPSTAVGRSGEAKEPPKGKGSFLETVKSELAKSSK